MPKLKEVKKSNNSMSWTEVNLTFWKRAVSMFIPKRELDEFLSQGYKISKVTITFDKDKELEINKTIENGTKERN